MHEIHSIYTYVEEKLEEHEVLQSRCSKKYHLHSFRSCVCHTWLLQSVKQMLHLLQNFFSILRRLPQVGA